MDLISFILLIILRKTNMLRYIFNYFLIIKPELEMYNEYEL